MTYTSTVCEALIETLDKSATLDPSQLAGYVADLDFWTEEIDRCFKMLDGYRQRFDRIAIASADAGASSYIDAAIDQAHRAVGGAGEVKTELNPIQH